MEKVYFITNRCQGLVGVGKTVEQAMKDADITDRDLVCDFAIYNSEDNPDVFEEFFGLDEIREHFGEDKAMEKFTAKEYVEAFMANRSADMDAWRSDYPFGISVYEICTNDTVDVLDAHDYDEGEPGMLLDCGDKVLITDPHNMDTRYSF